MANPFKFGTVVDEPYFTDRVNELAQIEHVLDSPNHLVLISPRRYGKSSLVRKAVKKSGRTAVFVNLQMAVDAEDLASLLLKEVFRSHRWEKVKHLMTHFRFTPTFSTTPTGDSIDISFQPSVDTTVVLEDVLALLEKVGRPDNRLVVVLDEFQEIMGMEKGLDKKMRAVMQEQQNVNYIILGSQETMMTEIFERKKSPFYHFGLLMGLKKIPYGDFINYIAERLPLSDTTSCLTIAADILDVTQCHPYYTQQLASQVWEILSYQQTDSNIVGQAVEQLTDAHDYDYERLWLNFNRSDRRVLQQLSLGKKPSAERSVPTSTIYSTVKRLIKAGYVLRNEEYEMEDPFFKRWIQRR